MKYLYEKSAGFRKFGHDWVLVEDLIWEYDLVNFWFLRDVKKLQMVVLRLSQQLTEEDRTDYNLIYHDLAPKVQKLYDERKALYETIGKSYDELIQRQTTRRHGTQSN